MRRLAVVTANWFPAQSVYRTLSAYVRACQGHYHLTLFDLNPGNRACDYSMFDEVLPTRIECDNRALDIGLLQRGHFDAVYYPDIGMNSASILLANMRLAPVQLMGTGHPVSTFGSQIDYFISGDEVEAPGAERHYSERLVLLPGLGAIYNRPTYQIQGRKKQTDAVLINCSWYGQKANAACVDALAEAAKRSKVPLHFRFFSGAAVTQYNDFLPFQRELTKRLKPAKAEVMQPLDYETYMSTMEEGDFGADCFHFGGSNTVSDLLYLGKPVVCLNGTKWYGRIGAALMKRAYGWHSPITAASYAADVAAWADSVPLRGPPSLDAIYSDAEAAYFRKALDYLLEHHERLKAEGSREPIRIPRDA